MKLGTFKETAREKLIGQHIGYRYDVNLLPDYKKITPFLKKYVDAMGWDDYNGSKGFSTDMYVKITTKDGEDIMDEVSLKKDVKINFLNSSTGKFREWDEDSVGGEIDAKQYSNKERDSLNKAIEEFGLDLPKPTSRKSAKTVWMAMVGKTDYDTSIEKFEFSR
mgnify:CR=1 FL=1